MTPGQLIESRRAELGWTQAEAAQRMGVTQAYWSALEADRKSPTIRTLARIAAALGCTVEDLVG